MKTEVHSGEKTESQNNSNVNNSGNSRSRKRTDSCPSSVTEAGKHDTTGNERPAGASSRSQRQLQKRLQQNERRKQAAPKKREEPWVQRQEPPSSGAMVGVLAGGEEPAQSVRVGATASLCLQGANRRRQAGRHQVWGERLAMQAHTLIPVCDLPLLWG